MDTESEMKLPDQEEEVSVTLPGTCSDAAFDRVVAELGPEFWI